MGDHEKLIMTPGPTAIPADVREAMTQPPHNPDVEASFMEYYGSVLEKLATVYRTDGDTVILGGEGILGLETAVESTLTPGDQVLCLANGVYGEGFADFVRMAGGEPTVLEVPYTDGFDVEAVKSTVTDHEFTAATMVHCETPTGVLNDLTEIVGVLQDAGVLTIVDAVSSLGGTSVPVEHIDICLGASQKCLSSPPGLTTLAVSNRAWRRIEETEQDSFYTSLGPWRDVDLSGEEPTLLPYTHLVSNIYALEASLDRLLSEGIETVWDRHESVADRCRERGREIGLDTFPPTSMCSPTVTAFAVDGNARHIQHRLESDHGVLVATGLGETADDILRIGHMGYNARRDPVDRTMDALATVLD